MMLQLGMLLFFISMQNYPSKVFSVQEAKQDSARISKKEI
jgi:hypothetical protein